MLEKTTVDSIDLAELSNVLGPLTYFLYAAAYDAGQYWRNLEIIRWYYRELVEAGVSLPEIPRGFARSYNVRTDQVSSECYFIRGHLEGLCVAYFPGRSKRVRSHTFLVKSEPHGTSTHYDESGNVISREFYYEGTFVEKFI